MYITYDELCQTADILIARYDELPAWRLAKRYRLRVQIEAVESIIYWIEQQVAAEECSSDEEQGDERLN